MIPRLGGAMLTETPRAAVDLQVWKRTYPAAAVLSVRGPHARLWTYYGRARRHGAMLVTRTS